MNTPHGLPPVFLLQEHLDRPRNRGRLENPSGRGIVKNDAAGDALRIQLRIEGGRILEARYRCFGHPFLSACASFVTECAQGQEVEHAAEIRVEDVARTLRIAPQHVGYVQMAMTALLDAITDHRKHHGFLYGEVRP